MTACLLDAAPRTQVTIVGDQLHLNGRPTYEGREWRGHKIARLLATINGHTADPT